jgi:parallel beta-helix repeat protein
MPSHNFVRYFTFSGVVALAFTAMPMVQAQAIPAPGKVSQAESRVGLTILYVNPQQGLDNPSAGRTEAMPYRTITYALQQATSGTIIQLAAGEYTAEAFPLLLPSGVTLVGNETQQGEGVVIQGGDFFLSPSFARQNVTFIASENTQIIGVTITNPNLRGTGIWVESGNPIIRSSTFVNNKREGIFVTGNAAPRIENNRFVNNSANGISVAKQAQGEIRGNLFENTGFGIAIGGNSAPIVTDNQIRGNRNGVVLTDAAHPRLQSNVIENNREYGLVIMGKSQPDLSNNTLRGNQRNDELNIVTR